MQSCRFAFAVHIMAVLALDRDASCPSSRLAATVNTNPVVIRRLLSDLRSAGLIHTSRGPRGGARLLRKPEKVTLLDIREAVEENTVFGTHPQPPSSRCPVGQRIEEVFGYVQRRATRSIARELERMTLADVLMRLLS